MQTVRRQQTPESRCVAGLMETAIRGAPGRSRTCTSRGHQPLKLARLPVPPRAPERLALAMPTGQVFGIPPCEEQGSGSESLSPGPAGRTEPERIPSGCRVGLVPRTGLGAIRAGCLRLVSSRKRVCSRHRGNGGREHGRDRCATNHGNHRFGKVRRGAAPVPRVLGRPPGTTLRVFIWARPSFPQGRGGAAPLVPARPAPGPRPKPGGRGRIASALSSVPEGPREGSGRGERIRTSGLYVPNVALYQAKLHPDMQEPACRRTLRTRNSPKA